MFRQLLIAGLLAAGLAGSVAASAQAPAATAAAPAYSTSETSIGDLLDNPATARIGALAADAFTGAAASASFGAAAFLGVALLASLFLGRRRREAARD